MRAFKSNFQPLSLIGKGLTKTRQMTLDVKKKAKLPDKLTPIDLSSNSIRRITKQGQLTSSKITHKVLRQRMIQTVSVNMAKIYLIKNRESENI